MIKMILKIIWTGICALAFVAVLCIIFIVTNSSEDTKEFTIDSVQAFTSYWNIEKNDMIVAYKSK